MSENPAQNVVTVTIAGEDYTLRAMSTAEHALECAALVDDAVRDVLRQTSLMQPQKAAILAALTLADQLLQTRNELDALRRDADHLASHLAGEVERRMAAG